MKKNFSYSTLFLIAVGIVVFLMIKNFIPGIISAFVLALFMLPLFRYISKKIPRGWAAFSIIFILIVILFVVTYFMAIELSRQASQYLDEQSLNSTVKTLVQNLPFESPEVDKFANQISSSTRSFLVTLGLSVAASIPSIIINILLTFFLTYYFLVYWADFSQFLKKAIPIKDKRVLTRIKDSSYQIFYGLTIIAVIELIISIIGFWIAGVKLFLFFALLVAIAAYIPMLGPPVIWVPIFVYYLTIGNTSSAIIVLITGLILTLLIDNWLVHIVVGRRSKINPGLMMLGILGGVGLFGLFGFIIGPLLIIFFIEFYKEYLDEIKT